MKPTVVQGLTGRAAQPGQELEVLNKEVLPVLTNVREVANFRSTFKVTGDTTDSPSTYKTIWESEPILAEGSSGMVDARAIGVDSLGFTGAYALYYGYIRWGGVTAQFGIGTLYSFETAAGFDARLTLVGDSLVLQVRDNGTAAKWEALVSVLEVVP